jgi:hypothetical protein
MQVNNELDEPQPIILAESEFEYFLMPIVRASFMFMVLDDSVLKLLLCCQSPGNNAHVEQ